MRKYYIVTQADTDEDGHFQYANGVFQDDDGNTELYINAEEARESLAKDVAEMGPSARVKVESVDWQLQALLGLCSKAVIEAENDFGAEDFAAPTEGGEQPEQPADGNPPPKSTSILGKKSTNM